MLQYVDPFHAVEKNGNCLPGPYLPTSIVRLGPETLNFSWAANGYATGQPITRFTHTNINGTGGGGRYGNIGVTPYVGLPRFNLDAYAPADETASAGYYSVRLQPADILAELTVTSRVGVHRYRFPEGAEGGILIDAGAVMQVENNMPGESTGACIGGFVEWISETEVIGRTDARGGWGHYFPYSVYFYARFDQPAKKRWVANHLGRIPRTVADGANCKAVAHFGHVRQVTIKVGISYVSIAKARSSVERETGDNNFDAIHKAAADTWQNSLSRIQVEGGTDDQNKIFYTLFTRLICQPADLGIDDEFPTWHSGVRHFTDFQCLWDSVRNANSLISLFDPDLEVAILNCMLDIADHTGWLPDAWIAGHSGQIQGGSSADILLCEAALKGFPGINYEKALRQMRKNNEVESPDPHLYGRYLQDYRDNGFTTTNIINCVSRHLEYAYQDWCIGALAQHLGQHDIAGRYFAGSKKVWNLWRDDIKFFAPKTPDGNWVNPFNPAYHGPDSWNDPYFYEGNSWQWSCNTQHDFAGLIARHGGPEEFIKWLDAFFATHYYSKETMLHVPYLYIYAGRPDKTADCVRACLAKYFNSTRKGLSDNEDMGCQAAFYMCSTMGLYPIMGQDIYLLTTPVFTHTEITLGKTGKTFVIEAPGAGPANPYVASATLNGKPLNRAWVAHREIACGAVLRFILSSTPTAWGTTELPPSPMRNAMPGAAVTSQRA